MQRLSYIGLISVVAVLYFVLAKLSLLLAIPPGYATAVWPPSGLALAAMLLLGKRAWPGIWLGAALVNLTVQASVLAAVLVVTGNAIEALVGAALIRHAMGISRTFASGEDVFKFVGMVAVAATISATIGVLSIVADGA